MGTKVIDKLRIQGNAAPRRGPEIKRPFHHPAFHDADAASHFVYQGDTGSITNGSDVTTIVNSHPNSAASRRYDHLQRVQQANRGLTSAEVNGISREGLPNIHFLLRGKPVHGEMGVTPMDAMKHQRVGHYKTSAKEVYRARHRMVTDMSSGMDQSNYFRAIRTPFHEIESNISEVSPSNYFYLGPTVSGHAAPYTVPGKRNPSEFTSSAPAILNRNRQTEDIPFSNSDLSLWHDINSHTDIGNDQTTQPGPTPRGSPFDNEYTDLFDSQIQMNASRAFFPGTNSMSEILNPNPTPVGSRTRHNSNWSRRSFRDPPKLKTDPDLLKDCLQVHQSYKVPLKTDISPREMVRLKHCPQAKVNYNNPYRNLRSKERKDVSKTSVRYNFNSVESYIHFNKIYPRASELQIENGSSGSKMRTGNGLPNIPRVNGFTSHCTDTVLLKMMFEMNKPKSGKSISKYSDVAVHKDLDEFMIVTTPSVSRSHSVVSRKTGAGQRSRSQVSFENNYKEEDEERVEKEKVEGVKDKNLNSHTGTRKTSGNSDRKRDDDDDSKKPNDEKGMSIVEQIFQEVLEGNDTESTANKENNKLKDDDDISDHKMLLDSETRNHHGDNRSHNSDSGADRRRPNSSASEPPFSGRQNDE